MGISGAVALRKESVDRNAIGSNSNVIIGLSLSARRAWIEIRILVQSLGKVVAVALRKESVDRNVILSLWYNR